MKKRLPVHLQEATFDVIWVGVRALTEFTREQLTVWLFSNGHEKINDHTVESYLQRLHRGGYLEAEAEKVRGVRLYHYRLIRNTGVEAPQLTDEGKPATRGRGREQMWRAMKVLGEFDYRELAMAASTEQTAVREQTAEDYCKHLKKAGYLRLIREANKHGGLARYRLIPAKNTGPKPPQIQRTKRVFDPNLGEVVWTEEEVSA